MWRMIGRQMWEAGLSRRVSPAPPYSYKGATGNLSDNYMGRDRDGDAAEGRGERASDVGCWEDKTWRREVRKRR